MSRSGYTDDDGDDPLAMGRWRAQVASAFRGKRGQAFLQEVAAAMDAMPQKILITDELVNEHGECCTIGVVCKARGLDVKKIDYEDTESVGKAVGIASQMAAEIEYENDEHWRPETAQERWVRMRAWIEKRIVKTAAESVPL